MPLDIFWPHQYRLSTLKCPLQSPDNLALIELVTEAYQTYKKNMQDLCKDSDFVGMAECLRAYSAQAKELEQSALALDTHHILSAKTKYYSSILEELPVMLMHERARDLIEGNPALNARNFHLGSKECIIRVGISPQATLFFEKKRIDCALSVEMTDIAGWCPLIGLEVKKYVDKTMFGTILDTYKSLRTFRPTTYYGFLAEDEAREKTVVCNSEMYDKEFILSGCSRNKGALHTFRPEVLERLNTNLTQVLDTTLAQFDC